MWATLGFSWKSESHSEPRLFNIFQTSTLNIFLPISKLEQEFSLKEDCRELYFLSKNLRLKLGPPIDPSVWTALKWSWKTKVTFPFKSHQTSKCIFHYLSLALTSKSSKKTLSPKKDKEILKKEKNAQIF